jgi:phage terminase large subunit-like protein
MISRNRIKLAPPDLEAIVVAIDPTVKEEGDADECGIVVAGRKLLRDKRMHGFVLEDLTAAMSPDTWAKTAVTAFHRWEANFMIGEVNQGGSLVKKMIQQVDGGIEIPFFMMTAKRGKHVRAIPVAQLYEQNRVHHVGTFANLEQQYKLFTNLKYMGPGSPNNADAAVWALSFLLDKTSRRTKLDPDRFATYRR